MGGFFADMWKLDTFYMFLGACTRIKHSLIYLVIIVCNDFKRFCGGDSVMSHLTYDITNARNCQPHRCWNEWKAFSLQLLPGTPKHPKCLVMILLVIHCYIPLAFET